MPHTHTTPRDIVHTPSSSPQLSNKIVYTLNIYLPRYIYIYMYMDTHTKQTAYNQVKATPTRATKQTINHCVKIQYNPHTNIYIYLNVTILN